MLCEERGGLEYLIPGRHAQTLIVACRNGAVIEYNRPRSV